MILGKYREQEKKEVAPIKLFVDSACLLFVIVMLVSLAIIMLLEDVIPQNIFFGLLISWGVFVFSLMTLGMVTIPYVRRKQIDFFIKKIRAWEEINPDFANNIFYDMANEIEVTITSTGFKYISLKETSDFAPQEILYDELNLSANAFYAPTGLMISILIISNISKENTGLETDISFILNGDIFSLIQNNKTKIRGLDEIMLNLEENMKNKCKGLPKSHFIDKL